MRDGARWLDTGGRGWMEEGERVEGGGEGGWL